MSSPRAPRASFCTLGCKVNQYETRETAADLLRLGYRLVPFGQPADVCVVNTCSVTHEADAKSRAALRRGTRAGADPLVVATGCYVETAPQAVAAIAGVSAVIPNADKPRLAEIVDETLRRSGRLLFPAATDDEPEELLPAHGNDELISLLRNAAGTVARTRAVIKIQDGCNHFCTFCIIPMTRGRLRSRDSGAVLAEARELVAQGFSELVLTGICIGDYGDEKGQPEQPRDPLAKLIEHLADIPGVQRLRLSSVDPADVTDDLIHTLAETPQACPHLHLSLQAGSDAVLDRMRRRYSAAEFRALVERIYAAMPGAGLTGDVIVGFPGETPEQFAETIRLCEDSRLCKLHVFPYSARTGTQAARWADDVPPAEKQRRVRELSCVSDQLGLAFAERHLGETVEVLAEQRDRHTGLMSGLTRNYLRVYFAADDAERGQTVQVLIESAAPDGASGVVRREIQEGS